MKSPIFAASGLSRKEVASNVMTVAHTLRRTGMFMKLATRESWAFIKLVNEESPLRINELATVCKVSGMDTAINLLLMPVCIAPIVVPVSIAPIVEPVTEIAPIVVPVVESVSIAPIVEPVSIAPIVVPVVEPVTEIAPVSNFTPTEYARVYVQGKKEIKLNRENVCEVYNKHFKASLLFESVNKFGLSYNESLDFFQDFLVRIYERFDQFIPEKGSFHGWAMSTWKHLLSDNHGSHAGMMKKDSFSIFANEDNDEKASFDISDLISVQDSFIGSETDRALYTCIFDMENYKMRNVMLLELYGYTQKEIAESLQLTSENVRVLNLRAKKCIKESLSKNIIFN
jgi:RNA polymerase sigma factor (sigma-70 family)